MKRFVLALMIVALFGGIAYASASPTFVTSNTVSFNTTQVVVTFNTTVDKIFIRNEGTAGNNGVWVTLTGQNIGWNYGGTKYTMPVAAASGDTVIIPGSSSITYECKTDKIGIVGKGNGTVTYIATSETNRP